MISLRRNAADVKIPFAPVVAFDEERRDFGSPLRDRSARINDFSDNGKLKTRNFACPIKNPLLESNAINARQLPSRNII